MSTKHSTPSWHRRPACGASRQRRRDAGATLVIGLALFFAALLPSGCFAASGPTIECSENAAPRYRIEIKPTNDDRSRRVVTVRGLSAKQLAKLKSAKWNTAQWNQLLSLRTGEATDLPAVTGEYTVQRDRLAFTPRYPLRKGLAYRVVFSPGAIPGAANADATPIVKRFSLPKPRASATTTVTHVYPSGDKLPENLLKFYLHFSAPMRQGNVYQYIKLLRADGSGEGNIVDLPFLELDEELWDNSGTRLTLLIDPGRIKRGLKPREDVGPSLEAGKSYTLRIDARWPDAKGNRLTKGFAKHFKVGPPDDVQPDPRRWKLASPPAAGSKSLVVEFPEPLDHALLHRVLRVVNSEGKPLQGKITVDRGETRWQFKPAAAWAAGRYDLVIDTILEDRAGNSIGRAFDVDVFKSIERRVETKTVSRSFDVESPSPKRKRGKS